MTDPATQVPSLPQASGPRRLLLEDDVVRAVLAHLELRGWTIESFALTHQHGDDIVATRGAKKLIVEAKGQGSARVGSRRYGLAFNRNQVGSAARVGDI